MGWIAPNPNDEDDHADPEDHVGQGLAQLVQVLLQRRVGFIGIVQHLGDVADFGVHPRGHDHPFTASVSDVGAGVGHVDPVA